MGSTRTSKNVQHVESNSQIYFVRWFRYQHPALSLLLFAVPNGGARNRTTGAILKAEGVVAGVADMLLLVPSGEFHGLALEFKTATGRQSDAQKRWQKAIEEQGYKYALVRSTEEAIDITNEYLEKIRRAISGQ